MGREVASITGLGGAARACATAPVHAAARRNQGIRRWLHSLLVLWLLLGVAVPAWAACPNPITATVASGGQVIFDWAVTGFDIDPHLHEGQVLPVPGTINRQSVGSGKTG